jgi:hypothetical protein
MHLKGLSLVWDRSCLLRCSLLLNARLQNWHLYFLSGASEAFRDVGVDAADDGMTATLAPGILLTVAVGCTPCSLLEMDWLQVFLTDDRDDGTRKCC